jgi:DNA-binding NarL/FixJ family response regulator
MIRVAIVDDHILIREGLKRTIEAQEELEWAGEAGTAAGALELCRGEGPSLVLVLDISLPDQDGIELLKDLRRVHPEVRVLVFSMHPPRRYGRRALRNGAAGYVTKDSGPAELLAAIRKVAAGGRYIVEDLAEELARDFAQDGPTAPPHEHLSDREFQILLLQAKGWNIGEIADNLHLSYNTVKTYRRRLLDKLGVSSNGELFTYALYHDLLE